MFYVSLGDITVKSASDIALVDYASASADVIVTPSQSDDGLLQPSPVNVESDASAANDIRPSEESVKVSESNVQQLMKNGFV